MADGKVLPETLDFQGRMTSSHQNDATDPGNAALNYGYGVLEGECRRAINAVGLEPSVGFLHDAAITKDAYIAREKHWKSIGFVGRCLIVSFSYSNQTIQKIHDHIRKGVPPKQIRQSHEEIVERVPKGYSKMAESPDTPIEAMRQTENLITYGVQFHPEIHDANHPAGKTILSNFARITNQ